MSALVVDPFYSTVNKANNRAALIHFSEKFKVIEEFDFDDNLNLAELKSAIISVPYKTTCTGDAFHKAIQMFTSSKGNIILPVDEDEYITPSVK